MTDNPEVTEAPPAPPPEPPKPKVDLALQIIAICQEYQPRLFAIKQGLFAPQALINSSWSYYSALVETDTSFLSEHIVESFRTLEVRLIEEMNGRVASLIGR